MIVGGKGIGFLTESNPLYAQVINNIGSKTNVFPHDEYPASYLASKYLIAHSGDLNDMKNATLISGLCLEKNITSESIITLRLLNDLAKYFSGVMLIIPDVEYPDVLPNMHIVNTYLKTNYRIVKQSEICSDVISKLARALAKSDIYIDEDQSQYLEKRSYVSQVLSQLYHYATYFIPSMRNIDNAFYLESITNIPKSDIISKIFDKFKLTSKINYLYYLPSPLSTFRKNQLGQNTGDMFSCNIENVKHQIEKGLHGGRQTLREQNELGGDYLNCPLFQNYIAFVGDDRAEEVEARYAQGYSTHECKQLMIRDLSRILLSSAFKEVNYEC